MIQARQAYAHELQPGDVFSFDPPRSPSFLVIEGKPLNDSPMMTLNTLCFEPECVSNGIVLIDRRKVVFLPSEYPTEHVDNQPTDYYPED